MMPFAVNTVVPIDPGQAFVEGYRAYQQADFPVVIGRMQLASAKLPEVADYALFYLASAQAKLNNQAQAADTYRRLFTRYPQSVLADEAEMEYAQLELDAAQAAIARAAAERVANRTRDHAIAERAQLIMAQAALAQNDPTTAYHLAQSLREDAPQGAYDAQARALAYKVLARWPDLRGPSLNYHYEEAQLLVREGQAEAALKQVRSGLALGVSGSLREELYWLRAQASHGDDARAAWEELLAIAPEGKHAAAASNTLAHLYWRTGDTAMARSYFNRVASRYPHSSYAPEASFELGRTYEDDGNWAAARSAYLRLIERYPDSQAGNNGRFRAPFMLYMMGHYAVASGEFAAARRRASGADAAMFGYWQGRALEQAGRTLEARAVWQGVAQDTRSNYYPWLASRMARGETPRLAAASAPDLKAGVAPISNNSAINFHLTRIAWFRRMELPRLERGELLVVAEAGEPGLRRFALAEMQASGAWYDAIELSNRMAAQGEISAATAERIRYPRGYWEQISGAAMRNRLDPWLVAALIRQESLYNPQARSVSDARGLMQLLPSTAAHWAPAAGLSPVALNLYDPEVSLRIGTTYLKGLMDMFGGNQFRAVAAYNGGEQAVARWVKQYPGDDDQWVENIGYRETRDYVKKVIGGRREYQLLYGGTISAPSEGAAKGPPAVSPG
jgi:soluble lytic murein transglycosylase